MFVPCKQKLIAQHRLFWKAFHAAFPLSLLMLALAVSSRQVNAQEEVVYESQFVELKFSKAADSVSEGSVHFNILTITNISNETLEGELTFSAPQSWPLILSPIPTIRLQPSESYYVPIRLSVPADVVGGISYMLAATLALKTEYVTSNAYLMVQSRSKWDMQTDKNSIYLNEFKDAEQFKLRLINDGNKDELIKLSFDIGSLLSIAELGAADSVKYVTIKAFSDSVFTYTIRTNSTLSYAEEQTSVNSWRASTVNIAAESPEHKTSTVIAAKKLQSCESEEIRKQPSPLNYEFFMFNIMSPQPLKFNNKLFGAVLFKNNRNLNYTLAVNNIYFGNDRNLNFSFDNNIRFAVAYHDNKINALVGDNVGGGGMHSINGRGIDFSYRFNKKNAAKLMMVQNPFGSTRGIHAAYSRQVSFLRLNLGLTYDDNPKTEAYSAYSIMPGVGFSFLEHHAIGVKLIGSNAKYSNINDLGADTSLFGFGYHLNYRFNSKDIKAQLTHSNSNYNYLRNSGILRTNLTANYAINNQNKLFAYFNRHKYEATKYPYNFYNPSNVNVNDHGRLTWSFTYNGAVYQVGPQFVGAKRKYFDPNSGFFSEYINNTLGVYMSGTFKVGKLRTITPNLTVNNLMFDFVTNDTLFSDYSIRGKWFYNIGINYYDYVWRVTIYYTSGATSDLYRSVLTDAEPGVSQALHIRPAYERYFRKRTIRVGGYVNYSYYLPAGRENFILNLSSDFFLKKNWQIFTSFNMYNNIRVDDELGRISSRYINVFAGFRKAVDIQQPRLKYYDIDVVCFNDLNGNNLRDEGEKPISNILVTITRDLVDSVNHKVAFPQTELLTDSEGLICYNNMPEGVYTLELSPLQNLENMFFLEGTMQKLHVSDHQTHYLPLVESYKVKGKVIIDRDPNSNEGSISYEGIKITAVDEDGYTYSTLTDKYGYYILYLPHNKPYTINMSNIFNENFVIKQSKFNVRFGNSRSLKIDFMVREIRREIKFNNGQQIYEFKNF